MRHRPLIVAGTLSFLVLVACLGFPAPALTDPTGAALPASVHLAFPPLAILFAPLFDLWDGVTLLAMPRLHAFLVGAVAILAACALVRAFTGGGVRWRAATFRLATGLLLLALFVLTGIRWRRPMAHLAGVPAATWTVDLHSHTALSHDAKGLLQRDFDLEASRRWHRRGGYDLYFVTDHNLLNRDALTTPEGVTPVACPGEELSLWGAHIVLLGNTDSVPRGLYADSAPGITRVFAEGRARWHALTLASIPEYDENHFADLPQWIAAGVDGLEVSNAAPKANRLTRARRDSVIALARAGDRWIAGVSDQHGMGATAQAWTLVPRGDRPTDPCGDVLQVLATRGWSATQVVERHRVRVDAAWPMWATIVAVPWESWRAANGLQVVSWLAWIWGIALLVSRRKTAA
ncbi:MAG TPA: hypothetical protein VFI13_12540 [Gemmatimonadales bacterium]|nr:hypothetical protein [Gemmatimonadales bacterium]